MEFVFKTANSQFSPLHRRAVAARRDDADVCLSAFGAFKPLRVTYSWTIQIWDEQGGADKLAIYGVQRRINMVSFNKCGGFARAGFTWVCRN